MTRSGLSPSPDAQRILQPVEAEAQRYPREHLEYQAIHGEHHQ